ncbi:hypothetical protein AOL_s00110g148 [Orbilia oligospora ATCC 24927]|uniref:Uncharacterized protein n=1 Tax=Arthrobotrys oligospora (strain ATCC 24927 / CBS 115.81 / DSM 1491) TaxID=756982 RepID=G1XKX8_ARTOA|nr:hypothetical protein AOL_s00110g148 [Orbilia oligospora ATCC 24927]EGX46324.1 hypothetical protein AOL_s00110g148 [Orbilia oligospora ATCC 24927]
MSNEHSAQYDKDTIAIISAIEFEMSAFRFMLDREHSRLPTVQGDRNSYIPGKLNSHNVVLAYLPDNQGKGTAAIIATNLGRTFRF